MNEYLIIFTSTTLGIVTGFVWGTVYAHSVRDKKPKLVERIASHKTEPAKTWSAVSYACPHCGSSFWIDAGNTEPTCGSCNYKGFHPRGRVQHTDRHT